MGWSKRHALGTCLTGLALLAACGEDEAGAAACRNGMAAFVAAMDIARGRLALPPLSGDSEAGVQIPGGRSEYLGDCRHRVVSYVERPPDPARSAEPRRERFEAIVRLRGETWTLETITFY